MSLLDDVVDLGQQKSILFAQGFCRGTSHLSKLLEHLTTQLSIVAVESCEGSFHIDQPLDHITGCFAISTFQDLESELDFRRVGVSWVTEEIDLGNVFFLNQDGWFWDQWKHRLPVVAKVFGNRNFHGDKRCVFTVKSPNNKGRNAVTTP